MIQKLDVDPKAIQRINITENLDQDGTTAMFFIIKKVKETTLDFSQGSKAVFSIYFVFHKELRNCCNFLFF